MAIDRKYSLIGGAVLLSSALLLNQYGDKEKKTVKFEKNVVTRTSTTNTSSISNIKKKVNVGKLHLFNVSTYLDTKDLEAIAIGTIKNFEDIGIKFDGYEINDKKLPQLKPLDVLIYSFEDDVMDGMRKKLVNKKWIDHEKPRVGAFRMGKSKEYDYVSKIKEALNKKGIQYSYAQDISVNNTGYIIPGRAVLEYIPERKENNKRLPTEKEIHNVLTSLVTHEVGHAFGGSHVCYGVFQDKMGGSREHFMGYREEKSLKFHPRNIELMKKFISKVEEKREHYNNNHNRMLLWASIYLGQDENECAIYLGEK